ncbi:MAG: CDP-diacylglycerol--serine O-phosphatidyltransferase [Bacteroidetes bacterium]|nr:CDP-diacylglycerol--serine O-phosphatidyltransferase [Bacteroidota bacterium]
MINIPRNFIPSLFTILNVFCGFMSIINSAHGNFDTAIFFIIYSALFDAVDGLAARLTKSASKFGVELDSLADVVSFGAAPSFILYNIYFKDHGDLGVFLSSLILLFAAIRLARFNVQLVGFDKDYFSGVPVPMAAMTICSYIYFYHNKLFGYDLSSKFIIALSIVLPILMVSKFRYDSIPKVSLSAIKKYPVKFIFLFAGIVICVITKGEGLFLFCLFYLSTGIFRGIYNSLRKSGRHHRFSESEIESKELN